MALAEAAGGAQRTVALMNRTALRLGAYDTFVETPSGLDGWRQLTSAYDMALFLRAALAQPRFVSYDRQLTSQLASQRVAGRAYQAVPLANQSEIFLTRVPGALVAKTGFTDAAEHTYLCAATRGGRRLGVIFLRAQRWPTDQWQQAAALLDWGYRLSPGTAPVGHLDAAVQPAIKAGTANPSGTGAARSAAAAPPKRTLRGSVLGYVIAGALLLAAAVVTLRRFWRR
jgi:D-alanyl-D-alanine carboxypeptidase (penicillin-binding protein 5/6)